VNGQTVVYGSWNVKYVLGEDGFLDAHGVVLGEEVEYAPGVDAAISCALDQSRICRQYDAPFQPAWLGYHTVLNPRMYEGASFYAYRYTPKHHGMSGDADPKELVRAHLHHVIARFPDLLPYLALPAGYHVYPPAYEVQFYPEEKQG